MRNKEFPLKPMHSNISRKRGDGIVNNLCKLMPNSRIGFWEQLPLKDEQSDDEEECESGSD